MAATVSEPVSVCGQLEEELLFAVSASGRGRALDVVIWDYSGLVGNHVAELFVERIAPRHPWLRWALVTRSEEEAVTVGDRLRESFPSLDPLILTADPNDRASVDRVVRETHMVLAAVGPFAGVNDLNIVEACVRLGADYMDVSSGPEWSENLVEKFDASASENGVLVVSMTLDDLAPQAMATFGGGGGVLAAVPASQSGSANFDFSNHRRAAKALSESVVPLLRARYQCTLPYKGGVLRPLAVDGAFLLCRPTGPAAKKGVGRIFGRRVVKTHLATSRL